MKKVLYIATTADNRNRLDGETIKCRLLKEYLSEMEDIELITVDTDNWKKHILKLVFKIMYNYLKCDEIIVSSADRGAHIVLDFFRKINCNKKIYYFVIGGTLYKNIKEKKWNTSTYNRIQTIYVEADLMKNKLNKININNVKVLNNFRKVGNFKNKYKKTKAIKFVYFGRVIKEKGIEESIKLVNRLNKENIKCTFDIYGQCNKEYYKKISNSFSKYIKYHGEIKPNSIIEYETLSQYDIFLFPTYYPGEGLPGSLIDAYISGLAIIASDWKYAREYIKDGENGIIFEYKNYDDMYNKTLKMINEKTIQKYKKKSKQISQNYILENLLKEFSNELRS